MHKDRVEMNPTHVQMNVANIHTKERADTVSKVERSGTVKMAMHPYKLTPDGDRLSCGGLLKPTSFFATFPISKLKPSLMLLTL
jgi:hypothetical protein